MRPRTKSAKLTFKRDEILQDIGNYAYVVADVMRVDAEHARHQVLDICQDGNIERVSRVMNLAHSEIVELLYPYTKEVCGEEEVCDNTLIFPQEYVVNMELPDNFAKSTIILLTKLIHEYFVYRILGDWLSITASECSGIWEEKLDVVREKINSAKNNRTGRVRRTLAPF